jgi:hypothetical protein
LLVTGHAAQAGRYEPLCQLMAGKRHRQRLAAKRTMRTGQRSQSTFPGKIQLQKVSVYAQSVTEPISEPTLRDRAAAAAAFGIDVRPEQVSIAQAALKQISMCATIQAASRTRAS